MDGAGLYNCTCARVLIGDISYWCVDTFEWSLEDCVLREYNNEVAESGFRGRCRLANNRLTGLAEDHSEDFEKCE